MPRDKDALYISVFREVRSYIIENNLREGDFLPTELSLSEKLGVSRNVLREAIKSMELMGMVEACPGRGTCIRPFNLDFIFQNVLFFRVGDNEQQVREMFAIRKMLELSNMREAFFALKPADILKLRECAVRIREGWENSRIFAEADYDFHMTLFRPLKNEVLLSLMDAIWAVDKGFQLEQKSEHLYESVVKHEAIVDALEKYDFLAFAMAMTAHFSSGKYQSKAGITYEEY